MPQITRESLRIERLCVSFKRLLLDFPVVSRADVNNSIRRGSYTEAEIDKALERLVESGFITIGEGPRGGVRYVRRPEVERA